MLFVLRMLQLFLLVIARDRLGQPDKELMTVFAELINAHITKAPEIPDRIAP